jgi:hypothetical protein
MSAPSYGDRELLRAVIAANDDSLFPEGDEADVEDLFENGLIGLRRSIADEYETALTLWRTVGRSEVARARACARSNIVLQAALAEWGATVDDDEGHNEQYRVVTGWTPKAPA